MTTIRLSHSAKETYEQCAFKYKLKYIDKWRTKREGSALVFGNALDNAFSTMLLNKDAENCLELGQNEFFLSWSKHQFNWNIDYFKSDTDISLLSLKTMEYIDNFQDQSKRDQLTAWCSLNQKGQRMIESYYKNLIPKVKKVISIQKEIKLEGYDENGNSSGDSIIGFADFIAEIENGDSTVLAVVDNKSTSTPYPKNSVQTKAQTALYSFSEGIEYGAFFTVNKKDFTTQAIIDRVPEILKEATINSFSDTLHQIRCGNFPKNDKACFSFGRLCEYSQLCKYNKISNDLYKKDNDAT